MAVKFTDITKLVTWLLPEKWRASINRDWVYSVVNPFKYLFTQLSAYDKEVQKVLTHNGQVVYLKKILNDTFDPIQRRITITDAFRLPVVNLWHYDDQDELDPDEKTLIYEYGNVKNPVIYGYAAYTGSDATVDFYVNVPAEINTTNNIPKIEAIINQYKLASKRGEIAEL